jgi:hypothetical protein
MNDLVMKPEDDMPCKVVCSWHVVMVDVSVAE